MEDQPDDASLPCINEILPPEILKNIFQRMEAKDLYQCINVCSLWENIVTETIEFDLHIGQPNNLIWRDYGGTFGPIEMMKQFKTRNVFISQLENPREELSPIPADLWTKPEKINYLWIDGAIHQGTFNNIMMDLSNLQKLEIHFNTLAAFNPGDISGVFLESLVNLKDFSIRILSRGRSNYRSVGHGFLNAILIFMSGAKIPKLECLNLSFPTPPFRHFNELIQSIMHFMIQHKSTLRKLKLFIGQNGGSRRVLQLPPGIPALSGQSLHVLQMTTIEIHTININIDPFVDWMLDFVNGQRKLEVIHLTIQSLNPPQIQQLVSNFSNTIKSIQLQVDTYEFYSDSLDLNVFSSCVHLKKLELKGIGRGGYCGMDLWDGEVDLIGGRLIPKTLETLTLIDLYISTLDFSEILQDQRNLKYLRCLNLGTQRNFGVPLETFIQLVSERNVEKIFLLESINAASVENGFQPNEAVGLNIESLLHHENRYHERVISLRLDGENYIQIEEEPYGQEFPDGRNFPNFVIHEMGEMETDEFHEIPARVNQIVAHSESEGEDDENENDEESSESEGEDDENDEEISESEGEDDENDEENQQGEIQEERNEIEAE